MDTCKFLAGFSSEVFVQFCFQHFPPKYNFKAKDGKMQQQINKGFYLIHHQVLMMHYQILKFKKYNQILF